jgi:hypothetical protein
MAVDPIFNVRHNLFDMTFLNERYWNKHMFMNTCLCLSHQIIFDLFFQTESMLNFDMDIFQ